MSEPTEIIAGDTIKFTTTLSDYPATDWTYTLALRGTGSLTVTATPTGSEGTDHGIVIPASSSAALSAGLYEYVGRVTSGSEAYTVTSGRITVKPDLLTAVAGDRQAHAEKMLTAIQACLEGRITADVVSTSIAGVSISKIPIPELRQLRASYAREIHAMKHGKRPLGTDVLVQFSRVT